MIALSWSAISLAQAEFSGPGGFPSLRNLNGLPGSGFPVTPQGTTGFWGAMGYSTPVAYSLGGWNKVISITFVSNSGTPTILDGGTRIGERGNGTFQLVTGTDLADWGRLTYGYVVLSSQFDAVSSLHFQPKIKGPVAFGIGILDVMGDGGYSGDGLPEDDRSSASPYIVATSNLAPATYLTLGTGQKRFKNGNYFANFSTNLTPRLKFIAEYDTFQYHGFFAYDLGKIGSGRATLTGGYVALQYATWALSYSF